MRVLLIFLVLCIASFYISAKDIPTSLNSYDLDSNKVGTWTILYDYNWNITEIMDSVEFYRIITYEKGLPHEKVADFYLNGKKQFEGFLLSEEPSDIYYGNCKWFNENGDVIEKRIINEKTSEHFHYEKNQLLLKVLLIRDTLVSYDLYIKDTLSFPLYMLYTLESYDLVSNKIALDLNLELLLLYEKINGKQHSNYASSLHNLAQEYSLLGDYNESLKLNLECLGIYEIIYGKKHLYYVRSLSNLSRNYYSLGYDNKALKLDLECLILYENIFGKDHPEYLNSLSNLAVSYSDLGNLSKSMEINLECLMLTEKSLGKKHLDYLTSLSNLAMDYFRLGDVSKAIELNLECLLLTEKILGKENSEYIVSLNNLAMNYSILGDDSTALNLNLECLKLSANVYGMNHPKYLLSLGNLATIYTDFGDFDKALELDLKCLSLREKILGVNHSDYALSLNNIASSYADLGNFTKSIEFDLKCLSIRERIQGKEHPSYAQSLYNLGTNYYSLKNYNESYSFLSKFQALELSRFMLMEKNLNTNLVSATYNFLLEDFQTLFNISKKLGSLGIIKSQYNNFCFLKGRELSRNTSMLSGIYQSNEKSLISLYENWLSTNKKISICYENSLNERLNLDLDLNKLQDQADDLERKLTKLSSGFASNQREYLFNDIVSYLKFDEVYIDIVNIQTNYYREDEVDSYYAYIIKSGDSIPELINLGSDSSLNSIYGYYSNYAQERPFKHEFSNADEHYGNICYEKLWSQLEPYLEGVSSVYFSPEGVYSKINPNVLYDSKASRFLIDKYNIVYVSNVEDFVHQKENIQLYDSPDDLYAVCVGNPTFLLENEDVLLSPSVNQSRSINQRDLDSLQRGAILSNLPGTQTEIDLISSNLKSKGWSVEIISGVDATETRVKNIEAPKILHIATHGFFFEDKEMIKRSNMLSEDNKKAIANPMTRSGLIFSGAENTINGEILADDNGWLNSYEASLLNLRGTELVVLSACETGSGDVQNGKGVYGLQRAIRVAGAESIIMSMWEVDDKATQELMTYFYDYWIDKKMSKKKAFKKAQQKIRNLYKHPYFWGAFIMLGK